MTKKWSQIKAEMGVPDSRYYCYICEAWHGGRARFHVKGTFDHPNLGVSEIRKGWDPRPPEPPPPPDRDGPEKPFSYPDLGLQSVRSVVGESPNHVLPVSTPPIYCGDCGNNLRPESKENTRGYDRFTGRPIKEFVDKRICDNGHETWRRYPNSDFWVRS